MNLTERALLFPCEGHTLVGVLSLPERPADVGVVVVVGGPQYRAGSHRQFVLLARRLASAGHAVIRFDYRGMGDSEGEARGFEHAEADIGVAIDALQQAVPAVRRVVLWGLCDGASAALMYCDARRDTRIAGLCVLNPWVRSEASQARTQVKHYYRERLMQRAFWAKLLRGGVAVDAVAGLLRSMRTAWRNDAATAAGPRSYQQRMASAWFGFAAPTLLVLSGQDFTAKEFTDHARGDAAWAGALARPGVTVHEVPEADHTFSQGPAREQAETLTLRWLASMAGAGGAETPHRHPKES
jgi:exosortase A-associated hydrolase 1